MAFSIDWRLAAVIAMLLLSAYNLILKWFLDDVKVGKEDLRSAIPLIFIASLILLGYFALTYKEVKTTGKTMPYLAALALMLIALTAATTYAYAFGELTIVLPILGLSIVGSALLAVIFLGEQLTPVRIAGIALALLSIFVLALEKNISAALGMA